MSSSSFSGSGSHYSSYNGSYSSVDFEKDKYTIKNAHAGQNKGLRYGTASMQVTRKGRGAKGKGGGGGEM